MNRISPLLISLAWASFILILSTVGIGVNLPTTLSDVISWDKLVHAIVYAVLSFFLYKACRFYFSKRKAIIYAWLIAVSYGLLMEIVQYSFFPNRYFELFDIFANIVGATINSLLIYFLTNKKSQSYG